MDFNLSGLAGSLGAFGDDELEHLLHVVKHERDGRAHTAAVAARDAYGKGKLHVVLAPDAALTVCGRFVSDTVFGTPRLDAAECLSCLKSETLARAARKSASCIVCMDKGLVPWYRASDEDRSVVEAEVEKQLGPRPDQPQYAPYSQTPEHMAYLAARSAAIAWDREAPDIRSGFGPSFKCPGCSQ